MANYKVADTELAGIADSIRARGGTSGQLVFPNGFSSAIAAIPNTYGAADEGKVVSSGALVAQTSLSINANGTYDTTENNEVTVAVQGGGGGGGTKPTFLTNSTAANIIAEAYASDYESGSTWGEFTLNGSGYGKSIAGLLKIGTSGYATFDLGAENSKSVTVYAVVARASNDHSSPAFIISNAYATSAGNSPAISCANEKITATYWGASSSDDTAGPNMNVLDFHVLAIAINTASKSVRYFVDGQLLTTKTYNNSGRYVQLNSTANGNYRFASLWLFAGVVEGVETDATILANHQEMLDFLSSAVLLEG
jgi:hypothetical protein